MTYEEVIAKIGEFIKFGSKLGLSRMKKLMELLGDPQEDMRIVHVAGTNGKGSVCRYVYEMLMENGYSTGLYTSPFLENFTERMEADGTEITSQELSRCADEVLEKTAQLLSLGYESPTEFEIITAIGFVFFKKRAVDVLVLEVGLGGRGDATNIIRSPLVCVITSISFDHTEYLGDSIERIAAEKAGIIKPGTAVVSQVGDEKAIEAIKGVCELNHADFFDVNRFLIRDLVQHDDVYTFGFSIASESGEKKLALDYERVTISMIGRHQIANAITAMSAVEVLRQRHGFDIDRAKTLRGIRRAVQKGRFEILKKDPAVIIDGAHNEAGAQALKSVMQEHFDGKKVLTVMGILQDKKADGIIRKIDGFTDSFIATRPVNPRGLAAADLSDKLALTGKPLQSIPDWKEAVRTAMMRRHEFDVVLFAGSLYLIGAARGEIMRYQD